MHIAGVNVHYSGSFHDMSAILERNFTLYRPSAAYAIWVVKKRQGFRLQAVAIEPIPTLLNTATRKGFGHVTTIAGDVDLPQVIVVVQHGLGPRKAAHPILVDRPCSRKVDDGQGGRVIAG